MEILTHQPQPSAAGGMKIRLALGFAAAAAIGSAIARSGLFSANYLPHRFCYLAQPGLIWTNVAMDALIAVSYVTIFGCLLWIAIRLRDVPTVAGYLWIFLSFALFIVACALTHTMEIVTVWWPVYPLSAAFKVFCAAASVPTAILFARATPALERNTLVQVRWLSAAEAQRDGALAALQLSEEEIVRVTRSEAELERANRYLDGFRLMIDAVEDYALFMLDPDAIVTTWNAGAERIHGFRAAEIVGKHLSTFYTAQQLADGLPERELADARQSGRCEDEGVRLRKDGTLLWSNVVVTALRDPAGELVGFGIVTRDLTQRRLAEQALRESHRQLNEVFECSSDSILSIDPDWTIVFGNSKAIQYLPDFRLGANYWECFPAVRGTEDEQHLRSAMSQRVEVAYERFYEPYQTWFRVRIYPSGEAGITAFFANIDTEKKLEEQLDHERLLREKRIEALSHMAGGLAHEISNPLAIIHCRASDLKNIAETQPEIPAEEVLQACDSIVSTSNRAIKILRGLRGFAREASHDPMEWASIEDIVEECLDLQLARFERHRIELHLDIAPGLPLLLCRETQIGQIVTNLLNNAFDAISQAECEVRWVRVCASLEKDDGLHLDVVDSGPGIDEQSRAHLMEPFFTTKTRGLGMGVGLSLSRAIAVEHGGSLTLRGEPGPTRFRLILPFEPQPAVAAGHPELTTR